MLFHQAFVGAQLMREDRREVWKNIRVWMKGVVESQTDAES